MRHGMDCKALLSLLDGECVEYRINGLQYQISNENGAVIANRAIFLGSHDFQKGEWVRKVDNEWAKIISIDVVAQGDTIKNGPDATENYIVSLLQDGVVAVNTFLLEVDGNLTTDPADWEDIG